MQTHKTRHKNCNKTEELCMENLEHNSIVTRTKKKQQRLMTKKKRNKRKKIVSEEGFSVFVR